MLALSPPGQAYLASVLERRRGDWFLQATTADRTLRLNSSDDSVSILIDGRVLGVPRRSTGERYDALRRPIGLCRRPLGLSVYVVGVRVSRRPYALDLNARTAAQLYPAVYQGYWLSAPEPLVLDLAPDLTEEEADWVLALCVLEAGHHGVSGVSSAY